MHELDTQTVYDRRWLALGILSLSLLVIGLDNTILNIALPDLAKSLGASNSQLQWIVDGYTIVYAGLILTTGSLGDRFGRKRALTLGLIVFGLASAVSAFSGSTAMLIVFRMLMGIGGALIMPATLSLLTNIFHDPKERARAIGVWAGVSAGGIALGPIFGGLLLAHFWWGSVFLVNIPVVIVALVAGRYVLPHSQDPNASRIDPVGAVLSTVGLMALVWGFIEAPSKGWTSTPILVAFGAAIVVLAAFIVWELRSDHPMLEIRFFRNARFSAANAGITLVFFALFGASFLITQQLQFVMGYSPLKAGLAMTPIALPMLILGPTSARIVERLGSKIVVGTGMLLAAAGLFFLSRVSIDSTYIDIVWPMLIMASGMGLTMAPATESIMGSIPREKAGIGSAMNDTTRQVGGALGVAVIGSVLASVYRPHVMTNLHSTALWKLADGHTPAAGMAQQAIDAIHQQLGAAYEVADKLPGGLHGPMGSSVVHAARSAFVDGFGGAVVVGAAIALLGALVVFAFLPAHAEAIDAGPGPSSPKPSAVDAVTLGIDEGDGAVRSDDVSDRLPDQSGAGPEPALAGSGDPATGGGA